MEDEIVTNIHPVDFSQSVLLLLIPWTLLPLFTEDCGPLDACGKSAYYLEELDTFYSSTLFEVLGPVVVGAYAGICKTRDLDGLSYVLGQAPAPL